MWFKWLVVVLWCLEVMGYIVTVGEPMVRTRNDAVICFVLNALLIAGLLYFWR